MIHSAQSRDYRNHVVKFCNRNFSAILRNLKQFSGCCRKGPRSCDCQFWLFFVSCAHLIPILRCVLTHKFFYFGFADLSWLLWINNICISCFIILQIQKSYFLLSGNSHLLSIKCVRNIILHVIPLCSTWSIV